MKTETKQFDLERLKGKAVAVNCKTEEQAQDFINWVNSLGVSAEKETNWYQFETNCCYILTENLLWACSYKAFYQNYGYEIISYEEALLKEPKDKVIPNLKPTVREEFIQKVQTEKIGIICSTLEELEVCYDFFDENMDKNLKRRDKTQWLRSIERGIFLSENIIMVNNTFFGYNYEYTNNDGFYEEIGYIVYSFKDIIYQQGGIIIPKEESEEYLKEQRLEELETQYTEGQISLNEFLELKESIDKSESDLQENYMVYVKGKGQPKIRHTYENVIKEAQRLSAKEIGKEVNVVKVLKTFKSEVTVREVSETNEIKGETDD